MMFGSTEDVLQIQLSREGEGSR